MRWRRNQGRLDHFRFDNVVRIAEALAALDGASPDAYGFTGPVARQFTQRGNAPLPVPAYVMARGHFESAHRPRRRSAGPPLHPTPVEAAAVKRPCRHELLLRADSTQTDP